MQIRHNWSLSAVLSSLIAVSLGLSSGSGSGYAAAQATVKTPVISPAAGTYLSGRTVTMFDPTVGSTIYYTTDGSTPTTSSSQYTGAISVPTSAVTETVRSFAVLGKIVSPVATSIYVITPPLPLPTFSVPAGSFMKAQSVTLASPQAGGVIHYTVDGTTPTTSSAIYNGTPIAITGRTTISALVAGVTGYATSAVAKETYSIIPATPFISPASGTYTTGRTVSISDGTAGVTLYYTTDGTAPTTSSTVYTGPISIPTLAATKTIRAFAVNDGVYGSATSVTYVIAPQSPVPTPTITPVTGTYSVNKVVTIADSLSGANIYYTTDGTTPTTGSTLYTGSFSFGPVQTGVKVVQALAVKSGYLTSSIGKSTITLSLPTGVIATAIVNSGTTVTAIPSDFMGFSHEWGIAQNLMGQSSTGVNTIYRQFINTLSTNMGGPLVLRIGGNTTDTNGPATAAMIEPFTELANAENVKFILGVNLGSNDLSLAQQQAGIITANLPSTALKAIEIGNEPDDYSTNGFRSSTYGYTDYLPQYQEWAAGVTSATTSTTPIAGPTLSSGFWIANAQASVASATLHPTLITQHKYIACFSATDPLPTNILLQPTSSTESLWALQPYVATVHAAKLPFRMAELNSICDGGEMGISNSFSSALWAVDTMFEYANIGIDGVNWHSNFDGGAYDLFHFTTWKNTYLLHQVSPLYYGLLFFSKVAGSGAQLQTSSTVTNSNIKIWITTDNTGKAHLVVINKELATAGNVQITLPGYTKGTASVLTASSYLATDGVTIGGQTFDGSTDGSLQGSASTQTLSPTNNVWTIPVAAMSAVEVDLQP